MLLLSNASKKTELLEMQSPAPSVKKLFPHGECEKSPTRLVNEHPCFCTPGDYCVMECVGIDEGLDEADKRINVASGEDCYV